jgi:hypothetical protein
MPTQYISSTNTLTRQNARYEVNMLSDQITPGGNTGGNVYGTLNWNSIL